MKKLLTIVCIVLLSSASPVCAGAYAETFATATQFAEAINDKDARQLSNLSAVPFYVRHQEWESATDGLGFVLGDGESIVLDTREYLDSYMESLVDELEIEDLHGKYIPVSEYAQFDDEMKDSVTRWNLQDAFLFLRGMGDVEHIVIIGVNRRTNKVEHLYLN